MISTEFCVVVSIIVFGIGCATGFILARFAEYRSRIRVNPFRDSKHGGE